MRIFLDSSALAKRYVAENGTERILTVCRQADEIALSVLCVPELISGFNRLKREGFLSSASYHSLKRDLAADLEQATVMELSPAIVDRTIFCLERASLRALDAIQLASAMESHCHLFLTADRRQHEAAHGLKVKTELVDSLS
jgi:predicted nucleic acid-binding protein